MDEGLELRDELRALLLRLDAHALEAQCKRHPPADDKFYQYISSLIMELLFFGGAGHCRMLLMESPGGSMTRWETHLERDGRLRRGVNGYVDGGRGAAAHHLHKLHRGTACRNAVRYGAAQYGRLQRGAMLQRGMTRCNTTQHTATVDEAPAITPYRVVAFRRLHGLSDGLPTGTSDVSPCHATTCHVARHVVLHATGPTSPTANWLMSSPLKRSSLELGDERIPCAATCRDPSTSSRNDVSGVKVRQVRVGVVPTSGSRAQQFAVPRGRVCTRATVTGSSYRRIAVS